MYILYENLPVLSAFICELLKSTFLLDENANDQKYDVMERASKECNNIF